MLYNYEPIFNATAVANAKAKDMIVIGKTNMDEFAMGGSAETSYFMDQPRMLGTTARCLVDLLVVQQLLLLQGKSVCPLVQIQVVLSANQLPSTGLLVSNQLMERFPVLVSLPLVAHSTKLDLSRSNR